MATVEEALVAILRADATVASLAATRIYPGAAPQRATLPAVVYAVISNASEHTHDSGEDAQRPRVQFACIGRSYSDAKGLAKAVVAALKYYQNVSSGVTIDAILAQNEVDTFVTSVDQSSSTYTTVVDFLIWHH